MDETEVTNLDYNEYVYWLDRVFGTDHPEFVKMQNQTLCAGEKFAFNRTLCKKYYFTHLRTILILSLGVNWFAKHLNIANGVL